MLTRFSSFAEDPSTTVVALLKSTSHAFTIQTGDYRINYDVDLDREGWIEISRKNKTEGSIITKLANGQHLDVTAKGTGEGEIYKWEVDRKDHRMFQSMVCNETTDMIEVTILSECRWAAFKSRFHRLQSVPWPSSLEC